LKVGKKPIACAEKITNSKYLMATRLIADESKTVHLGWMKMKENFAVKKNKPKFWQYFVADALTVITGLLGLLNLLMLREMILLLLLASSINPWSWAAIDKFGIVLLAIAWLVVVYLSNHYYQKGFRNKRIWSYFLFITGLQMIILFLAHILPILVRKGQYSIALTILEGIIGIACVVSSFFIRRSVNKI